MVAAGEGLEVKSVATEKPLTIPGGAEKGKDRPKDDRKTSRSNFGPIKKGSSCSKNAPARAQLTLSNWTMLSLITPDK